MIRHIALFLKGLAMGSANVIPGVSGGTIALITGIYEELIQSVKSFDLSSLKLLLAFRFKEFWSHINGTFLFIIFAGIGVSIITLARLFKILMENPTTEIWLMAFFFGLILVSVYSVGRTIESWSPGVITALIVGLVLAIGIALLTPASENAAIWYLMLCGVVAMCSMILPGLSGSFVLILMGNYKLIMLDSVSEMDLKILIPVAIGAFLGLGAFSRALSWVFKNYRDMTLAVMTGFILGSLVSIWPWKHKEYLLDEAGEILLKEGKPKVSGYEWYFPDIADTNTLIAFALIVGGGFAIWLIERSSMPSSEA